MLFHDIEEILSLISRSKNLFLSGVSTHFENIEDTTNPDYASTQFALFSQAIQLVIKQGFTPDYLHAACSAAILLYPDTHLTLVRPGISLYGIWSSEAVEQLIRRQNISCELRPVLRWKTHIAQIKSLPVGTPIGYGLTERLKQHSRIAVLPVGYWDGYDRLLSSVGEVLIGGIRCKVLGRICMNMMMVDVSAVPKLEKEQIVTLIGVDGRHEIRATELARNAQTIPYEILTRINPQLPRVIVS